MNYTQQTKIDNAIENLIKKIADVYPTQIQGRIEIVNSDNPQIIEFVTDENGKWNHTGWHKKSGDKVFSIINEYKEDIPLVRKIKSFIEDGK